MVQGLELPDEDGVFVLDTFQGTPELVELLPSDLSLNQRNRKGLATLNPLAGQKATVELNGAHAKVHLHVNDPAIYLSLEGQDNVEQVLSHAVTVQTHGAKDVANRKHGAHSPKSGFAIVKVDQRREVRIIGAVNVSASGKVTQNEDVIPTKAEVMAGKHWLKLTPETTLTIGEYALVEILSPSDISQSVWDFRVDPRTGDNPASLGPIEIARVPVRPAFALWRFAAGELDAALLPLFAREDARADFNEARHHVEDGDATPGAAFAGTEALFIEIADDGRVGEILRQKIHHEKKNLVFMGIDLEALAILRDAKAVGYGFTEGTIRRSFGVGKLAPPLN